MKLGIRGKLGGLALGGVLLAGAGPATRYFGPEGGLWRTTSRLEGLRVAEVGRGDVAVKVTAGGQVESAKDTVVTCELENLQFSSRGQTLAAGGSSTILDLVPEGTTVRRDDVLCRLDASDYEELVRQQELKVSTSRSERDQATHTLAAAEAELREYRDGLKIQMIEQFKGQIALAEAELSRLNDRVTWVERMEGRRFVSAATASAEREARLRAGITLKRAQAAHDLYLRYGAGAMIRTLALRVETAGSMLSFQDIRISRLESQLRKFRKQVELCTVRAPHDGFVIYAPSPGGRAPIEEGARVRQKQPLFHLPDLARMEVRAQLNESIVDRIRGGMRARVRVEALDSREVDGHVIAVAPLAITNRNPWVSDEVKNYEGRVALEGIPSGMRPGMSVEVEIETGRLHEALLIPSAALSVEAGREVCYVADEDDVERREVDVEPATAGLLEVRSGLAEGERVVLNPRPAALAQAGGGEPGRAID